MQVSKWGNSLAVRLPKTVVRELQLEDGDEISLHVLDVRKFGVSKKLTSEEVTERLKRFEGMMPEGFKFDRDEANERSRD